MSTLSQQSATIDMSHGTPPIIIEDVDDLPHKTKSPDISLPWYADVEVVRQFIRTIHYLQNTAIAVQRVATQIPSEARDKMLKLVAETLDSALTPISPTRRATMLYNCQRHMTNQIIMREGFHQSNSVFRMPMEVPPSQGYTISSPLANFLEKIFSPISTHTIAGDAVLNLVLYVAHKGGINLDEPDQSISSAVLLKILQVITLASDMVEPNDESDHWSNDNFLQSGLNSGLLLEESRFRQRSRSRGDAGLVLSCTERRDVSLPWKIERRVKNMMHHDIDLRPFDAQILVPRTDAHDAFNEALDEVLRWEHLGTNSESCSPQSFPPSPLARIRVMSSFTSYSDEVLYRARDELRSAEAGTTSVRLAVFNPDDSHPDVILSCGCHVASKCGEGLYRSVRSAASINSSGIPVYFEMEIQSTSSESNKSQGGGICIGVSSSKLNLNTHVGAGSSSIAICSSGHVVKDGQWTPIHKKGFCDGDTVSCLVITEPLEEFSFEDKTVASFDDESYELQSDSSPPESAYGMMHHHRESILNKSTTTNIVNIWFFLNGVPLCPLSEALDSRLDMDSLPEAFTYKLPSRESLFPTLSLYSSDVKVLCHFAAEDILYSERVLASFPNTIALDGRPLK